METDSIKISVPLCTGGDLSLLNKLAEQREQGVYLFFSTPVKQDALRKIPVTLPLILQNLCQQLVQQAEQGKRFMIIGSISDLTIACWPVMAFVKQRFPHLAFYLLPVNHQNYISETCAPDYQTMLETTGAPISLLPDKFPRRLNKYYELISGLSSTVLLYAQRTKIPAAMQQFTDHDMEIIPCLEQINERLQVWKDLQAAVRSVTTTVRKQCSLSSPVPIDISAIESLFQLTERWNAKGRELGEMRNRLGIRPAEPGEWG